MVLGITHLINIYLRATSKTHIYSHGYGRSTLFWWLENRKLPWIRSNPNTGSLTIAPVSIKEKTIFTYVEPIFVMIIGWFLISQMPKDLHYQNLGWFLALSAGALFIDERKEHTLFREHVLDMMDGEIDGQRLMEEYNAMKGGTKQGGDFEKGAQIF